MRQPLAAHRFASPGTIDDDDSTHRRLSAYVEGRIDKLLRQLRRRRGDRRPAARRALQPRPARRARASTRWRSSSRRHAERDSAARRAAGRSCAASASRRSRSKSCPASTGDTFDIVAPITGTVVERKVYEGQYVKEGDVLFEIADFSKMWFVFDAYERDLAWIRVGQPVEITTPSVPGKVFTAPIAFIDPNLVMDDAHREGARGARQPARRPIRRSIATNCCTRSMPTAGSAWRPSRVLTVPRSAVLSPGGDAARLCGERRARIRAATRHARAGRG